jgi:hypothetical protein
MFYCSSCDHLVDSDAILFVYNEKTDQWTCMNCLEADPGLDEEQEIIEFNELKGKYERIKQIVDYMEYEAETEENYWEN